MIAQDKEKEQLLKDISRAIFKAHSLNVPNKEILVTVYKTLSELADRPVTG